MVPPWGRAASALGTLGCPQAVLPQLRCQGRVGLHLKLIRSGIGDRVREIGDSPVGSAAFGGGATVRATRRKGEDLFAGYFMMGNRDLKLVPIGGTSARPSD